ncbi:hypothetical protein AX769_10150 [Frondihabitans sp. PAMC 28766]|uniref:hypothetical protein n=1 Tax=Frondihabitans sp. PAMC 28766 TaxID=1795630 RepID=UPI00078B8FE0|nr:hypothetical protein [Frondihabitans sp. PAMC 28766]AMM20444.1 hypothetical protein AX769_10150 [Frondihabitans sp. PAMC 28766]
MTTTKSTLPGKRLLALGAGLLLAVPLVSAVGLAAPAPRASAAAATTEAESPDYASEILGDPWDYSNSSDQNTDASTADKISVSGGHLNLTVRGGQSFNPIWTEPGSLPTGRDGSLHPVDTSRYTKLSFEMNQPSNGQGVVYFFTCAQQLPSCAGGQTFPLVAGDHLYDLTLTSKSNVGAKIAWKGAHVVALRMVPMNRPANSSAANVSVNWIRLYDPSTPHGAYPPGNYSGFSVTPRPLAVVDSPNNTQGTDVTTAQGRPQNVFTGGAVPG